MSTQEQPRAEQRCVECGAGAPHFDSDGAPLCARHYAHLLAVAEDTWEKARFLDTARFATDDTISQVYRCLLCGVDHPIVGGLVEHTVFAGVDPAWLLILRDRANAEGV